MKDLLRLIRPKQWIKNVLVFAPMFFAGSLFDIADIKGSLITFVA